MADALTSPDVNLMEPIFDPLSLDLILVAALGGLEGIECLKASLGLVPKQFMAERSTFIQKIVNSNLTADKQLSAKQLETLTCLLSASNYAKHHVPSQAYLSNLRQVSEDTGVAHTAFLAPPVSQCIIPECQGSLSRHHPLHGDSNGVYIGRWPHTSHKVLLEMQFMCNNLQLCKVREKDNRRRALLQGAMPVC